MLLTDLTYPFVQYALVAGVLIALSASLLGVTLVLRQFSLIGDGLSHVAFGAMAVAMVLQLTNKMVVILPLTILSAIVLLKRGQQMRVMGDAAIAMVSVGALALGYLLVNLFSQSANISGDVCTTLFGSTSILTLTVLDVVQCLVLSIVVILVFVFFYHRIFALTFDETFTKAMGLNTKAYNLLIAIVTATIIVLAMNLVGSLLVSALIVFPTLSAMQLFHSFKQVVVVSGVLSVLFTVMGILTAIMFSTPVGATIVVMGMMVFLLFYGMGRIGGQR
ncbi:metal ABC transporter permease [Eubacterium barkeri]|uniref:Zinc transport system permease protein n=1 Tax=Eubacterium barkeri TaxID=1528 RepID=A0A1H3CL51_EUBBA|nr:metal ABC transporter permease [Eubacterium barkeri]SDX54816.1 zinc transport system permease protein [Eubacterium barkeri]